MNEKKAERLAAITVIVILIILQIAINHIAKVSAEQIQRYNIQYKGSELNGQNIAGRRYDKSNYLLPGV